MGKDILFVVLIILLLMAVVAIVFYGLEFNGRINNSDLNIKKIEQQISKNSQELKEIKDGLAEFDFERKISETTSMSDALRNSRDARRLADMTQLFAAQEKYFIKNNKYFTSSTYPGTIADFTTSNDPSGVAYGTVNNISDATAFCYYAKLERPNTRASGCAAASCDYYVASQKGLFFKATFPKTLADCATAK